VGNNQRRITRVLGVAAGGLLAAVLPMAVASADEFDFSPDTASFDPSQVEGYPPLINEVTGTEQWGLVDLTTNSVKFAEILSGTDTETTIGSFTNDDYLTSSIFAVLPTTGPEFQLPDGTQIDVANYGLGFENEWIDIPSGGTDPGVSDLLVTPFGDFALVGSAFADLATALS
jgi:hypothetical protein